MTLYIVGTPIGNLEDITLRALRVLREVSLIAAENTRKAGTLLSHYQITTPVISYFEGNERRRIPDVLEALERGDVALISEAGMPGISPY
jgi:16S rRNA (cytidine1402-2'-O)-methyltransferase